MLKLVVSQPGQPDREYVVSEDSAIIGRVEGNDVVVEEPYVSRQHVRIMNGVVVEDLGSSNGTFIDGQRLKRAQLLGERSFTISQNGVQVRVELEEEPISPAAAPTPAKQVDEASIQANYTALEAEVARLRRELDAARDTADQDDSVARLTSENENLRERLDSLKSEVEGRELEDADSVQARLAMQRVEQVQALNQKLQNEADALRGQLAAAEASGGDSDSDSEAAEALEAAVTEVLQLRGKVAELEEQLAADSAPSSDNVSDLFFKLQADNVELKRKLAAADQGPPVDGAAVASKHLKELMEARLRITGLEAELTNLRVAGAPAAAPKAAPVPAASAAPVTSDDAAIRQIMQAFADDDIEALVRPTGGPSEEFLLIESLRLLRHVEKVVTRVAGDLIQLFRLQTMLPDTVGTYRDHVATLLSELDDARARAKMVEYMETLGRWLVASIASHRKAAVLFATQLKTDLSEEGLTADSPLPSFAKVPMLASGELWKRTQDYLSALSPDAIDERLDELAREQAQSLLNETP